MTHQSETITANILIGLEITSDIGSRQMTALRQVCQGMKLRTNNLEHMFSDQETTQDPHQTKITCTYTKNQKVHHYRLKFTFTAKFALQHRSARQDGHNNQDLETKFTIFSSWHYPSYLKESNRRLNVTRATAEFGEGGGNRFAENIERILSGLRPFDTMN